jgi:hypothetical protein
LHETPQHTVSLKKLKDLKKKGKRQLVLACSAVGTFPQLLLLEIAKIVADLPEPVPFCMASGLSILLSCCLLSWDFWCSHPRSWNPETEKICNKMRSPPGTAKLGFYIPFFLFQEEIPGS